MHVRAVYAETEHYKLVDGQSLKNNISTRSVSWLLTGLGLMVNSYILLPEASWR